MGVPKFFKWIYTNYPNVVDQVIKTDVTDLQSELTVKIDNYGLDLNAIIHPISQKFYPSKSKEYNGSLLRRKKEVKEMKDVMFLYREICNAIDNLFKIVKPRKRFIITIDGVAGSAKQAQQRTRRFRSAKDKTDEEFNTFDSNCISPGTEFLFNFSVFLKEHIKNNNLYKNIEVIISDERVVGEGEHKLIIMLKEWLKNKIMNRDESFCIHSPDADLIMLSLVRCYEHLYILRENIYTNVKCRYLLVKISELRKVIIHIMTNIEFLDEKNYQKCLEMKDQKNKNVIIWNEDWCLSDVKNHPDYLFVYGDNHIRKGKGGNAIIRDEPNTAGIPTKKYPNNNSSSFYTDEEFDDNKRRIIESIDDIKKKMNKYSAIVFPHNGIGQKLAKLPEKAPKTFEFLTIMINELKESMNRKDDNIIYDFVVICFYFGNDFFAKIPSIELNDDNMNLLLEIYIKTKSKLSSKSYLVDSSTFSFNIDFLLLFLSNLSSYEEQFISLHKNKLYKENRILNKNINEYSQLNLLNYRRDYYREKLHFTRHDQIVQFCKEYLKAETFVMRYYILGMPDWHYFFPYKYTPFFRDLYNCVYDLTTLNFSFTINFPLTPFEQLLSILPSKSSKLLPKEYAKLINSDELKEYFPTTFEIDYEGKSEEHEGIVLIPFMNIEKMCEYIKKEIDNIKLSDIEKVRNSVGKIEIYK